MSEGKGFSDTKNSYGKRLISIGSAEVHEGVLSYRAAQSALTNILILEDLGVAPVGVLASELPHIEERLPINVGHQSPQVVVPKDSDAQLLWPHCRYCTIHLVTTATG